MRRLNNIEFANIFVSKLKKDLEKTPKATKFAVEITTEQLQEQFDERVFENIVCTEIKCKIQIIEFGKEVYRVLGELNNITFKNGSKLYLPTEDSENSGRGITPFSNWDQFN